MPGKLAESRAPGSHSGQAPESFADRQNLLQLVHLRALAVAGQLGTILLVQYVLHVPLPLREMLTLLGLLALFNVGSWLRARRPLPVPNGEIFAVLLVDVAALTGQLYYAGGITNSFMFLYLLQVVLGAVLLRPRYLWAMVAATTLAFLSLVYFHRPLQGLDVQLPAISVAGLLLCFMLEAVLLVVFIGRISSNLRQRDASVARLRQRAAEEDHIVRMGLLASGAAHELGTPLATLSVIVGDWSRMEIFAREPDLREELHEMQRQIGRCKTILGGILTSAGETRGEAPVETTLHVFLDDFVAQWKRSRAAPQLAYQRSGPDLPIISDTALQQMLGNVLDNALEASPVAPLHFDAHWDRETLLLRVTDHGPGFPAEFLERVGAPYQSSKGTPGRGLGLFLSVNVARTLGGQLQAHNRPEGGAEVLITLPLATLVHEDDADGS